MRRILLPILLICLLCGCKTPDIAHRIAPFYENAAGIDARLAVSLNAGSYVSDFILDWHWDGAVNTIRVEEPAALRGVTLTADAQGRSLLYEDAVITLPAGDGTFLSPLELLLPVFVCWKDACYTSAAPVSAGEVPGVSLHWDPAHDGGMLIQTDFDAGTLLPVRCSVFQDGICRLSGEFLTVCVN